MATFPFLWHRVIHVQDRAVANAKLSTFLNTDLICKPWRVVIFCELELGELFEYPLALVVILMVPLRLGTSDVGHHGHCDVWGPVAAIGEYLLLVDFLILFESPGMVLAVQEFFNRFTVQILVICLPCWHRFLLQKFVITFCFHLQVQARTCIFFLSLSQAATPSCQALKYHMSLFAVTYFDRAVTTTFRPFRLCSLLETHSGSHLALSIGAFSA